MQIYLNYFFYSDQLDATVQNCIDAYTSDWVSVRRKYHHHSSSNRPREDLEDYLKEPLPQQEFEIDDTPDNSPDFENVSRYLKKNSVKLISRKKVYCINSYRGQRGK